VTIFTSNKGLGQVNMGQRELSENITVGRKSRSLHHPWNFFPWLQYKDFHLFGPLKKYF
jgi:hypothetical protein